MITRKKPKLDAVLGLFIALGLIALVVIIFLIGQQRKLFDTRVELRAHFPSVAGLAVGADVMLSGVVVGHVSEVKFPILRTDMPENLRDIIIVMRISHNAMEWIREDSVARIDTKGLLGDKLINISIGSPELSEVAPHTMLKSSTPLDLNKSFEQAQKILENASEAVDDAKIIFKGFAEQGGDQALANSVKSIEKILKEIETGGGIKHLNETLANLSSLTKAIKTGPGLLHSLFYDEKGKDAIAHASETLKAIVQVIKEIKEGNGLIHELIYGQEKSTFIASLNKIATDMELVTKDLKDGRGSLGLLIKDPSLYNELYGLIGNLRRNALIKSVIRHNLSREEKILSP